MLTNCCSSSTAAQRVLQGTTDSLFGLGLIRRGKGASLETDGRTHGAPDRTGPDRAPPARVLTTQKHRVYGKIGRINALNFKLRNREAVSYLKAQPNLSLSVATRFSSGNLSKDATWFWMLLFAKNTKCRSEWMSTGESHARPATAKSTAPLLRARSCDWRQQTVSWSQRRLSGGSRSSRSGSGGRRLCGGGHAFSRTAHFIADFLKPPVVRGRPLEVRKALHGNHR
ncbi:uncharacterized protein LOC108166351 [Poecilia reticulata]|uniref:uncharacterized protein LOC108166351 n=1 Tax=Poecilia reticulata TaxID=8081 RepID=UPI0007EAE1D6|nr:PREDICTED: uncharacterized protein LOC108166351 [Poecilia reticulata]